MNTCTRASSRKTLSLYSRTLRRDKDDDDVAVIHIWNWPRNSIGATSYMFASAYQGLMLLRKLTFVDDPLASSSHLPQDNHTQTPSTSTRNKNSLSQARRYCRAARLNRRSMQTAFFKAFSARSSEHRPGALEPRWTFAADDCLPRPWRYGGGNPGVDDDSLACSCTAQ